MDSRKVVLGAALAGLLAAGTTLKASTSYAGDDQTQAGDKNSCKGKDKAAADKNSCKGKAKVAADKNSCKGKNGCSAKADKKDNIKADAKADSPAEK